MRDVLEHGEWCENIVKYVFFTKKDCAKTLDSINSVICVIRTMVRQCFVCKKLDYLNVNLTFHRIPVDVAVRRAWFSLLDLPINTEMCAPRQAYICSGHFLDEDFEYKGKTKKKYLKKGAVPVAATKEEESSSDSASEQTPPKRPKTVRHFALPLYPKADERAGPSIVRSSSSSTVTASEGGDEHMQHESVGHKDSSESLYPKADERAGPSIVRSSSSSTVTASEGGDEHMQHESVGHKDSSESLYPKADERAGPSIVRSLSSSTVTASEVGDEHMQHESVLHKDSSESLGVRSLPSSSTLTASETEQLMGQAQIVCGGYDNVPNITETLGTSGTKKRKRHTAGNLSSSDFSTPRKAKRNYRLLKSKLEGHKTKLKTLQQCVRRLRLRVKSLTSLMNVLKEKALITENAESTIMASLPSSAAEMFNRMLKGPTKQKYTPALRSFALTLSFYSPKAYNFVRQTFNRSLPHLNTICKWYQSVDGSPGWTKEAVNALHLKTADAAEKGKKVVCNLVLDEMSIRKQVEWTGKKFTGYVDIGTNISADTLAEAKEVLVFMLVSVNDSWKIPVGYFLLSGLCASEKASLVKSCLQFLHESDVKVLSLTFDGAPTNFQMAQLLGANFKDVTNLRTSFKHPVTQEDVFIFPDACHMLKLVRNCLAAYLLLIDNQGGRVEWKYLEALVNLQCEEGLHAGTKIKTRHVKFAHEKMKVRLAAQTLSKSVSDALLFLEESNSNFKGAAATANFCKIFNDLFDILNSKNRLAKYVYKKPLSATTKDSFFSYLDEIKKYIQGLQINGESILTSGRKTGFLGFLICIESLMNYYQQNVEEKGLLKYILTYKLSQDHLELFFGAIRSKGGCNNNPTARQFEAAYKRLIVRNEIKSGDRGNAINLDATTILNCSSRSIVANENGDEPTDNWEEEFKVMDDYDFTQSSSWALTDYVLDVVGYIAGFVVKSLMKSVKCIHCLNLLEGDRTLSTLQKRKEYKQLHKASQMVVTVCQSAEKYFRFFHKTTGIFNRNIKNLPHMLITNTMRNLPSTVMDVFGDHLYDDDPIDNHANKLINLILQMYFKIRIHYESKKSVANIVRIRTTLNKTVLFKNQ